MSLLLHHSKPQHHIDNACGAGGQFVSKPRSRGFTWADGVPARLWLRYLAVFLDPAGLWLWRGGPCHSQEVDMCPTKPLQIFKDWDGLRLNVLFICLHSQRRTVQRCSSTSDHRADTQQERFHAPHWQHKQRYQTGILLLHNRCSDVSQWKQLRWTSLFSMIHSIRLP